VKIKQGKNKAKTSLLNSLNVALGIIWAFGCARTNPITVRERSFIKGTIAVSRFSPLDVILFSYNAGI
jgi:hypothetical protein